MLRRIFYLGMLWVGAAQAAERPNVVLIVGDDIGFSDIGCYGSEIHTPNLDRLAENGLRFKQFYNMAKCNPSRSSLFSGLYLPREHADNALPFTSIMAEGGYYTAMSGKEHFDKWVPKRCRSVAAFQDCFVMPKGVPFFVPPSGSYSPSFRLNGEPVKDADIKTDSYPLFKTDFLTDYALGFLDKAQKQAKPFFLYLPYHAAHYPLQARPEDIAKYRGTYRKGWDVLRAERLERLKKQGLIGAEVTLSPPSSDITKKAATGTYRPWASLTEQEQDELDLEMAVFAAMVDRMDQNIGRVIEHLKKTGMLDNTLIVFFSDNGSCPYNRNETPDIPPGGAASYRSLCAAWANVGNTPFRYFKRYGHEGGSRTHCIAYWPGKVEPGLTDAPSHLVDLYPTFLELAGVSYPKQIADGPTPQLDGHSLVPVLRGETRPAPEAIISGYTEKMRMFRSGDWKIVRVPSASWELYNMAKDPCELDDLAKKMPEKLQHMQRLYTTWQEAKGEK